MSHHFFMGAINKLNNTYEYPKIANKKNKYKCPECEKNVIFRNGKIKQPHFAHYKSDNPCTYYERPSESQIHKEAKMIMKTLLINKESIYIYRKCMYCKDDDEVLFIFDEDYNDEMKAIIEYKFNYNDSLKSADVALIQNNKLIYIFEICYKNKTREENRPEPWFEINAVELINLVNNRDIKDNFEIECIRNNYKCGRCQDEEKIKLKREKEDNNRRIETSNMEKEDKYSSEQRYLFLRSQSINLFKQKSESLKTLIKQILEMKVKFIVERTCKKCNQIEEFDIPEISQTSTVQFDYDIKYKNSKITADVVYIDYHDIISTFEIYSIYENDKYINYPEPWFKINVDIIDKLKYFEKHNFNVSDVVNILISEKSVFKLECTRKELCYECIEKNKCDGRGNCLIQSHTDENKYIKNKEILCSFNCLPKKCSTNYCKSINPQWVLDTRFPLDKCINCKMGIEPDRLIYLHVPYDRKDEAKILGAKWWSNGKRWVIKSNHYNKKKILELFDEASPGYW